MALRHELRVISQDRELRVLYEQRMKAQRDAATWRQDWEAKWLADGKKLGLDEGKKEGAKALRAGIAGLCALLDIELTAERQAHLEGLDLAGVERLQARLLAERAWPEND